MTIGCIRILRHYLIHIYHKKSDEYKESNRDDENDFSHIFCVFSGPFIYFLDHQSLSIYFCNQKYQKFFFVDSFLYLYRFIFGNSKNSLRSNSSEFLQKSHRQILKIHQIRSKSTIMKLSKIHWNIIFTKNLLTNTIFHYNRLTSIGDSRLLTRHKNTLPRWTFIGIKYKV